MLVWMLCVCGGGGGGGLKTLIFFWNIPHYHSIFSDIYNQAAIFSCWLKFDMQVTVSLLWHNLKLKGIHVYDSMYINLSYL